MSTYLSPLAQGQFQKITNLTFPLWLYDLIVFAYEQISLKTALKNKKNGKK